MTFLLKYSNYLAEGNYPLINKNATSIKDDFSASCSIGYPLYSKIPLSPSINEIFDVQEIVFI